MSVVRRVEAFVVVYEDWCVCWWILLGTALGRERVGRVSRVVVSVWLCVVKLGKKFLFVLGLAMRGGCLV